MKPTTGSLLFSTQARLGLAGVCLGAAALTGWAQSTPAQPANPPATERGSERAQERASDRSALRRDMSVVDSNFSRSDRKFIEKFTAASQRELAMAQLAVERATNPQVKAYAQKMVQDHQMMHADFMTVAAGGLLSEASGTLAASSAEMNRPAPASATTATPATTDRSMTRRGDKHDAKQDRHYRKLMEKSGEDFDEAFVKRMVKEHDEAVDMLEDLVENDDRNPQLRAFANKHLPGLRAHLSEAKQLEDSLD